MIEIKDKVQCCGCNACGDICPKKCITYETDIEGFWYPVVNKNECINCGVCEKVCPVIHSEELKHNDYEKSICYAAENKNIEVVFDSTSGGLFSALANAMYKQKGYVGGAIFNDDMSVRQYISADKADLPKLRSSKYLQSHFDGFYTQVKDLLVKGEKVLVCGSPCQMAALRTFLGKDYENLIILDYICRGINSPKVWRKYLDTFEERYGSPVVYAKAKSKEYGWHNLTQKVTLANGKSYFETRDTSLFTQGYLRTGVYCRPSCYECKFKGFPRIADITLADFWGVEKLGKGFDKNLGTSLVMVNSKKGEAYFETIKPKLNIEQVSFDDAIKGNPALVKPLNPPLVNRDLFFNDLNSSTFTDVAQKYIQKSVTWKRKIKNFIKFGLRIIWETRMQPASLYKTIKYSGIKNLLNQKGIIVSPYCLLNISKKATININGVFSLGKRNHFTHSHLETRFLLQDGATFNIEGNNFISYGADIEIFSGATFTMKGERYCGHAGSNIGLTISCMDSILIEKDVQIGRNVTIRDNNGNHFMNLQGYKNSKPVVVKEKSWLCEQCLIMPGVIVGEGAIVGARAVVLNNVPDHALVSGNPASVIYTNVLWKY